MQIQNINQQQEVIISNRKTMLQTLCETPQIFYNNLAVSSAGDHFLNDNLSLSQIKHALPEKGIFTIKALLNILIGDLVLFINVGKSMTKAQIIATADMIIQEYGYYKPEDCKLIFTRAKKGFYGQLYDRLDGQLILGWFAEFDQERAVDIENLWQTANTQLKKREAQPLLTVSESANAGKDELFKKNIAVLLERSENNKKAKLQAETQCRAEKANKGPVYDIHQTWLKQFDVIWKRQGYNAKRLITRYGLMKNPFYRDGMAMSKYTLKQLDISAYLEHKQWQYITFNLPADQRRSAYANKYPSL